MKLIRLGIYLDNGTLEERNFYTSDFNAACERAIAIYPDWISITEWGQHEDWFREMEQEEKAL